MIVISLPMAYVKYIMAGNAKQGRDQKNRSGYYCPQSLHVGPVSARSRLLEETVGLVLQTAHRPVSGRANNLLIGGQEE